MHMYVENTRGTLTSRRCTSISPYCPPSGFTPPMLLPTWCRLLCIAGNESSWATDAPAPIFSVQRSLSSSSSSKQYANPGRQQPLYTRVCRLGASKSSHQRGLRILREQATSNQPTAVVHRRTSIVGDRRQLAK